MKLVLELFVFLGLVLIVQSKTVLEQIQKDEGLERLRRTSERDPYVFNLFEVILTTLESKLRRVENMDKAIEHLVRRIDAMEGQLSLTLNNTSKIVHLLDVRLDSGCFRAAETVQAPKQVTRVVRHRPYNAFYIDSLPENRKSTSNTVVRSATNPPPQRSSSSRRLSTFRNVDQGPNVFGTKSDQSDGQKDESGGKMEQQLDEVVKRVAIIDTKLSSLQEQLDTNSIVKQTEELMASASESYRIGIGLGDRLQAVEKKQDFTLIETTLQDLRNNVETIDKRLQHHADTSEQNILHLTDDVYSLRMTLDDLVEERRNDWCTNKGENVTVEVSEGCVSPFQELNKKSEKILTTMVTANDLQNLEPKSLQEEQLRQSKMLEELKKHIDDSTNKVSKNLQEMRKDVRRIRIAGRENQSVNPVALLQKNTESNFDNIGEASSPPSDILDQRVLSQRNASGGDANGDRTRHAGVIFPQKHKKPVESAFLASSSNKEEEIQGYSCLDLLNKGQKKSGTYHLKIRGTTYWFLQVYCDMTTAGGGWTVIQRRDEFGEPRENFNRGWADYKHGFGHPEKELWLGNENIYMLTNTDDYVLRVDLEDFDGSKRYAEYSSFKLHDETDFYKLEIGGYNGTAGDALNDPWYGSNLSPFSTFDKDNDRSSLNCASMLKGGWWWRSCGRGLNGLYLTNPNDFTARQGIVWFRWRGWDYTLKKTLLMIRPKQTAEHEGVS